ncbi:MAG: rhodanese-like domain-containing protein [Verrucomicrobiae bacterium]|nr:rhodanese-like domain-containing protein [Verrucomicrobiae bacterium]
MKKSPISLFTVSLALAFIGCDSSSQTASAPVAEKPAPATEASAPEVAAADSATKVDHVDAKGAAEALASADPPTVIDVRTPEEFAEGHIEGATMIDFKAADFESKLSKLDRDKTYLIHCRSGKRSTACLPTFEKLGFQHVLHLDGGFNAWQEAGEPVAK